MIRLMLVAAIIASVLAAVSPRHADAHTGYYRNVGNNLNLREGPSGDYAVIGKVNSWDVVKAFGHKGNWLKLRVLRTGQVGWAWLWNFHPSSYVPPPPPPEQPALQLCFWNYWGQTMCAPYWIAKAVYDAARAWGASYWALMSVAACESNFVVYAYAYSPPDNVYGIFQFRPSTYYGFGGTGDIYNVYGQANIAAKMFSQGLAFHWHCAQLMGIA